MSEFSVAERELLTRVAALFDVLDPVPDGVRRAAEDAALVLRPTRTWRRLELLRDNMMSARERRLGFGPGGLDVRIRQLGSAVGSAALRVRGVVEQPAVGCGAVAVWVRWPGGAARSLVGAGGRFEVAEVPAGPLCLAVTGLAVTGLAVSGKAAGKATGMGLTPWFVC